MLREQSSKSGSFLLATMAGDEAHQGEGAGLGDGVDLRPVDGSRSLLATTKTFVKASPQKSPPVVEYRVIAYLDKLEGDVSSTRYIIEFAFK
jgi:hypothetical protein